ncbi:MAG: ABC transporter ATP-binding protein [Anaerolineae bacterium]|nr:ABC transporter ATP-binding protein [Anaerolineae bacterium]
MTATVRFDNVSKKFTLRHERTRSFQEAALAFLKGRNNSREDLWALKDVSFAVERGKTVGIIGPNGSGKSTVLKLITRILEPTSGQVIVQGRVSALIELGAGFHPDLTGRENVYLNGSLLGFSRNEMKAKFDRIVEFSELEKFIDVPIKHYSSGMHMRLGFAVAIHVDPDILLIDEILAVGDQAFQNKCLGKIGELKSQGVTILFVSHDLEAVRNLCPSAIWLENGVIQESGTTDRVIDSYLNNVVAVTEARLSREQRIGDNENRWGSGEVEITEVKFLDAQGRDRRAFKTGEKMVVRLKYHAHIEVRQPVFGVAIYSSDGVHINGPNTKLSDYTVESVEGAGEIDYIVDMLPLLEGSYELSAAVYDQDGLHAYDHQHRMHTFIIQRGTVKERYGIFYIPSRWDWRSETPVD